MEFGSVEKTVESKAEIAVEWMEAKWVVPRVVLKGAQTVEQLV